MRTLLHDKIKLWKLWNHVFTNRYTIQIFIEKKVDNFLSILHGILTHVFWDKFQAILRPPRAEAIFIFSKTSFTKFMLIWGESFWWPKETLKALEPWFHQPLYHTDFHWKKSWRFVWAFYKGFLHMFFETNLKPFWGHQGLKQSSFFQKLA